MCWCKTIKYPLFLRTMVIMLLFNSTGSLFAASTILAQAKTYATDDIELICTGASFKWMSVSAYQQSGKIEFVEPPKNVPLGLENIKCSYSYLNDSSTDHLLHAQPTGHLQLTLANPKIAYFNAEYQARKHQLAISRAPLLTYIFLPNPNTSRY
ncbi:hypothetical protein RS130_09430 [Paraglaciecola aquimarina]|uniref:Uncharacterized protein n=1 Tax=Paraglaciecola aquimarina TaxID=1235557 RepID=A0ABU3SVX3_9ALTE|nr:hypothetical protein [Paraglaciecola aquimarina]MDU0354128.1 hypothetical protein [Paraglaciecola aquimarina]